MLFLRAVLTCHKPAGIGHLIVCDFADGAAQGARQGICSRAPFHKPRDTDRPEDHRHRNYTSHRAQGALPGPWARALPGHRDANLRSLWALLPTGGDKESATGHHSTNPATQTALRTIVTETIPHIARRAPYQGALPGRLKTPG